MWASTLSSPSFVTSSASLSTRRNPRIPVLRLKASLFDFPLASKIIVRNLPYSTSEQILQKEFSAFGEIAQVKLIKDQSTKRFKGHAFIQYKSQDDAMLALEHMDHKIYEGRVIYVEIAKPHKHDFGRYPRTSGPPENPRLTLEDEEVADCWY